MEHLRNSIRTLFHGRLWELHFEEEERGSERCSDGIALHCIVAWDGRTRLDWEYMLIREYSYCKGKDCKKHTLHKVTQCEYPEYQE